MSQQTVKELLNRQKIVESMLHNQPMARHDLVEGLVHKQHSAELQKLLARLSATSRVSNQPLFFRPFNRAMQGLQHLRLVIDN